MAARIAASREPDRACWTNGEIDAATLTPYTARVGTALINQQVLLTGAPPNKRQLAQIVDTVFANPTPE